MDEFFVCLFLAGTNFFWCLFFFLTLFFKFLPHPQEQFHANLPNKNYHRNTVNTSYNIITGVMMAAVS